MCVVVNTFEACKVLVIKINPNLYLSDVGSKVSSN
jgi:hypothetical protein